MTNDAFAQRTPHYLRIYRDLKTKVTGGVLAPGERLQPQRELAHAYGVTVMTVRQALQLLEQEELVVMRHGLGTFVAPSRITYATGNLRSFAQEVRDQGLELHTRVLSRELVVPHPHVAELLKIENSDPVYSVERLRLIGDEPVVYQHSQLQPWLSEGMDAADLSGVSLYDYLQESLSIEIAHARESIHAVNLPAREATLLEKAPGSAAILSERLTFTASGEAIIFDRAFMAGDRVSIYTERLVGDLTVGYRVQVGDGEAG